MERDAEVASNSIESVLCGCALEQPSFARQLQACEVGFKCETFGEAVLHVAYERVEQGDVMVDHAHTVFEQGPV